MNEPTFPNPFSLNQQEIDEVNKIMNKILDVDLDGTPANLITAYQALTCAVFSMMRHDQGTSKADMEYVANLMHEQMKQFIRTLP